jgi:hypothetical protein
MVAEKFDFLFPRNFVKLEVAEIKVATSNLLYVYMAKTLMVMTWKERFVRFKLNFLTN